MDIYNGTIGALLLWNFIAFILMGMDKRKAQKGKRRIREKTLFLSAFLFGGIGILLGMYVFRHKTKHWSFKIWVPVAVAVNIIVFYYMARFVV